MDLHDMTSDGVGWVARHAQSVADGFGDIVIRYPGVVFTVAAVTSTLVVYGYIQQWMNSRKPRNEDEEMRRRIQLDQKYADAFGDVLFDMMYRGEITRHEYRRDCKRFGIAYRLSDLLTKKNPKRGLRYRVTKNCEEMHRTPTPKLPPELPHQQPTVVVVAKRKVWLASGKASLRLKSAP